MHGLIRLSEATALALHAVCLLARSPDEPMPVGHLAAELRASEAHLAKVMQRLSRAGLVRATRGPHGGFVLGRPAADMTLLDVCTTIEGPLDASGCLFGAPICQGGCQFGDHLHAVAKELLAYLANTRVVDVTAPIPALATP